MNAPEYINDAHEALLRADDALSVTDVAREIHGTTKPNKTQIKAAERQFKELHGLGLIAPEFRTGGVAFYRLIVAPNPQVCDLVQTEGASQTSSSAERVLTPEARTERDDFEREVEERGCTCFISPPCGFCMHPGNPRNQEEDETAWMAAGDSEGGETDAQAVCIPSPEYDPDSVAFKTLDFANDPALQYLAPEDYEMPPADPVWLAKANQARQARPRSGTTKRFRDGDDCSRARNRRMANAR